MVFHECDAPESGIFFSQTHFMSNKRLPKVKTLGTARFREQKLIELIMTGNASIASFLSGATACIVTKKEHTLLSKLSRANPAVKGWDRYRLARIKVWDNQGKILLCGRFSTTGPAHRFLLNECPNMLEVGRRLLYHSERRPALPDGLPPRFARAPCDKCGPDSVHHSGG